MYGHKPRFQFSFCHVNSRKPQWLSVVLPFFFFPRDCAAETLAGLENKGAAALKDRPRITWVTAGPSKTPLLLLKWLE